MKKLKTILLGKALANDRLSHEKLSRTWGLPIVASDAVSSVAYAVEEILYAMLPMMGLLAVRYVGGVSLSIIFLLLILVFSYSQTITHYPKGGGAYDVSKENFGRGISLAAAACLIVGYILTAAVSIASSTAAIVAAFPSLAEQRVLISLVCLALITLINLRGVSESSKIFGVPTYLFIASMAVLIVAGVLRSLSGSLAPIDYSAHRDILPSGAASGMTLMVFLRAFASGCSGLTGVEAVSNTVPNFKDPPVKTAKHVLYMLGGIVIFIFGGTGFLAGQLQVIPLEKTTVISQIADAVFGKGIMFYVLQFTTALILLLAANTAYSGMPVLMSILSHDRFVPKQFSHRGAKLSFSNGIILISVVSALLLVAFNADTHALIPFYAVGVLVSFTISQAGMFVKWMKMKSAGWQYKSLINGFGALVTLVGSVVVFAMRLLEGAWVIAIIIPLVMWFMSFTHKNYHRFSQAIRAEGYDYRNQGAREAVPAPCVVLVHYMNKGTLKALDYAMDISSEVCAVHIDTTPSHTALLREQWEALGIAIPLTVIPAPYRDVLEPLADYISEREARLAPGEHLTVILTKFMSDRYFRLFHNQTPLYIERQLSRHKSVVTSVVPFICDEE
ncbi:MAG: APC family permease [Oscillospiraceae bacterium]|nr:APC family permease [Oscillospiraceae bacterium]